MGRDRGLTTPPTPRGRRSAGALAALTGAATAVVGGLSFASVFDPAALAGVVVPAGIIGLLVALTLTSGRVRTSAGALVLVIGAMATAAVAGRSLDPALLLDGLVDGPRRLLSGGLPADEDAPARVVAAVVVLLGTVAASALARRDRGPWAVLPAGLVLLAGTAAGFVDQRPRWGVAVAWAALAVVLAGWRRPSRSGAGLGRPGTIVAPTARPAAGGALLAVAVAAGLLVAGRVDGAETRFTARDVVEEPTVDAAVRNPVDSIALLLSQPERPLGRVTIDDPFLRRLPVAALGDYDGEAFAFAEEAEPAGRDLPAGPPGMPVRAVDNRIELEGWTMAALPHTGRARHVTAPDDVTLGYDPSTGRLLALGAVDGTLEVVTEVPDSPPSATATFSATPEAQRATTLPDLTPELTTLVDEVRAVRSAVPLDLAFAEAVAGAFRDRFRAAAVGRQSRDGLGLTQLGCIAGRGLAAAAQADCQGTGTRLQLAAAYVVALRAVGAPTRLVVGFEGLEPGLDQPLTSHRLTAWAEVSIEGQGWVAVDPVDEGDREIVTPPPPPPTDDDDPADGDDATSDDPTAAGRDGAGTGGGPDGRLGAGALAVLLATAVVAAPGVLRRWRGRRRRRGEPAAQVVGAWWELRDRLVERGERLPGGATVTEVLARSGPAGRDLAGLVNGVAFGGTGASSEEAETAWAAVAADEATWRRDAGLAPRVRRWWRIARPPRSRHRGAARTSGTTAVRPVAPT